jgi:hypothetical protein
MALLEAPLQADPLPMLYTKTEVGTDVVCRTVLEFNPADPANKLCRHPQRLQSAMNGLVFGAHINQVKPCARHVLRPL